MDYGEILKLASEQNLQALVCEKLCETREFTTSGEYARAAADTVGLVAGQSARTEAFLELYRKFEKAGLQLVIMKGIICRELYGKFRDHRPSGDEDILVRQEDFPAMRKVMEDSGYRMEMENVSDQELEVLQEITFNSAEAGLHIEVHLSCIYMDHLNGIDAGKWIYENFPQIYMVFVSESRDFGPELFELNALHYLVKPCRIEDLREVRRRYAERERNDAVVRVESRNRDEIPFPMITYIESVHNNLEIHLRSGGMVTVRNSLQNFMEKLEDRFLRINRGIVVNMDAVEKMNSDSCEICGMTFMLSRKTRRESRKRYNDFLFASVMRLK